MMEMNQLLIKTKEILESESIWVIEDGSGIKQIEVSSIQGLSLGLKEKTVAIMYFAGSKMHTVKEFGKTPEELLEKLKQTLEKPY